MESLGMIDPKFWANRRVFVTGHTGFKGVWIALFLKLLGARVYGYALPPEQSPGLYDLANVSQALDRTTIGDVRDLSALRNALMESCAEIVIHLAAQPLVRVSYRDPIDTFSINIMGTANLLEAVRSVESVRAVIVVTTDKVYEARQWVWGYRESDRLGGFDPYSSSKACAELVTSAYRQSFFHRDHYKQHGVGLSTARAGNVIGGGDYAVDRLVPDVFRAFRAAEPILIRNPRAVRPWQHVLEPLRGYLMLAQSLVNKGGQEPETLNFGPHFDDALSVEMIVKKLVAYWGHDSGWALQPGDHPHETSTLRLDIAAAQHSLGWIPSMRIDRALELCCEWHRELWSDRKALDVTFDQIQSYLNHVTGAGTDCSPQ